MIAHPVNPPTKIPLVELVPAPWTSVSTVEAAKRIMIDIGQSPVVLGKEVDGFILNRLQYALLAEAVRLVQVSAPATPSINCARAGWSSIARRHRHMCKIGTGKAMGLHGPFPDG